MNVQTAAYARPDTIAILIALLASRRPGPGAESIDVAWRESGAVLFAEHPLIVAIR